MSAAGEPIPVIGEVVAPVRVGTLHVDIIFVVLHSLITPVILGIDFLQKHGIVLDFTTTPVTIQNTNPPPNIPTEVQPILELARHTISKVCTVASIVDSSEDIIDNCAVPLFDAVITYDTPQCQDPDFATLLQGQLKWKDKYVYLLMQCTKQHFYNSIILQLLCLEVVKTSLSENATASL